MSIKTLLIDLETSLMTLAGFSLKQDGYISHDNIIEDWYILCAAWKWHGKAKVYGEISTGAHDDKNVVEALREVIIEADEIIYHNGKKFDWKKLNARIILNDLEPMPKPKEIDTLIQARKHFAFTSNRLDYLGKVLGCGGKIQTSHGLWLRALKRDEDALKEMFKYNKGDVVVLEKVYDKLAPHIDVGYNRNLDDNTGVACPGCGGYKLQERGWSITKTGKFKRYQCQDCARWFQDGKKEPQNGVINR